MKSVVAQFGSSKPFVSKQQIVQVRALVCEPMPRKRRRSWTGDAFCRQDADHSFIDICEQEIDFRWVPVCWMLC